MRPTRSFLFRTGYQVVFFVSQILALYLLLRGHNLPGGGFIGGLVSGLALVMLSYNDGPARVQAILRVDPHRLTFVGLGCSFAAALIGPLAGAPFLTHYHAHLQIPLLGEFHIGTPLLFDLGVFLVVVGVFVKLIFLMSAPVCPIEFYEAPEERDHA